MKLTDKAVTALTHAFMAWALRQGLIERNPAVGVQHPADRKRERLLTASEIRALWQATAMPGDFNTIVRLLLLTGCRASEIGSLRWSEVFSDRIVIAEGRVRTAMPVRAVARDARHPRPAAPHLDQRFVFGREPGAASPLSSSKIDSAAAGAQTRTRMISRTFATVACELGIAPHVVETALNHVSDPSRHRRHL